MERMNQPSLFSAWVIIVYSFGFVLIAAASDAQKNNQIKRMTMKAKNEVIDSVEIHHQFAQINGIRYHYAEAGKGPLVVLLHGFPGLWYSWRHQIAALAKEGYHAVAPDLRGFGESEVTGKVEDYSLTNHAKDVKALIDHLDAKEAVVIGHDWGANLMWLMPMLYPETVVAVSGCFFMDFPVMLQPRLLIIYI